MLFPRLAVVALFSAAVTGASVAATAPSASALDRGAKIYAEKCVICHQPSGQGVPPVYPPLAGSDWLKADRERTLKVLCEGLSGRIVVNGQAYENVMPAQILDDAEVAAVLNFVTSSWGKSRPEFTGVEVAAAREKSQFKTYAELVKAASFQPLPKPPVGWTLHEIARLPEFCVRLAGGEKQVYALAQSGGVYTLDFVSGAVGQIFKSADYIDATRGDFVALGITLDREGRLWIVTNQNLTKDVPVYTNEVVIWRSNSLADGHPLKLQPWFTTTYPRGVGGMNHGVSNLAFGPDGKLYVSSGSRTDGGESSNDPHYFGGGEVDHTSCIWRLDPASEKPEIEVIARGIRNPFGFAWDDAGRLFSVANGPDASPAEEMDFIEPGRHYGFPYQFSDWPVKPGVPYAHTPPPPPEIVFTLPVKNLGPSAGGSSEKPLSTFDPHSSPAGMIWCGADYPEPLRNGFLVTRFGNLLGPPAAPEDVGFDVLSMHLEKNAEGEWQAHTTTVLAPLGRPIDVLALGGGRVLVLEYTRPLTFKDRLGWLPGRILELAPDAK